MRPSRRCFYPVYAVGCPDVQHTVQAMRDLGFVFGSIVFFAIMIAYVAACTKLGDTVDDEQSITDMAP